MSEANGNTRTNNDVKDDLRQAYRDVKKFVKEHPTATVGTLTAVIGWRIGRRGAMKSVTKTLTREVRSTLNQYDEALALSSVWHREGKQVTEAVADALEFIDLNHMSHEWAQFLSSKGRI